MNIPAISNTTPRIIGRTFDFLVFSAMTDVINDG
jgi:hypothetical protein